VGNPCGRGSERYSGTSSPGQRVKHGDRVSFQTAPDKRNPAKFCAVAVQVGSGGINDHLRSDLAALLVLAFIAVAIMGHLL
jgi:hypothetical protein